MWANGAVGAPIHWVTGFAGRVVPIRSAAAGKVHHMFVLLALIGMAGVVVAVVAVIRGRLGWARITSRKVAVLALVGAFAVFLTGSALASTSTTGQQGAAGSPTTVLETTSSALDITTPETTTVVTTAPVTTTTTTRVTTTTRTTTRRTTAPPPRRTTTVAPPPRVVRTTTARPVAPVSTLTCSASMSDSSPTHNETTDVVVRTGTADADVTATAHYSSKNTTKSGEAASSGTAEIPFDISTAKVGFAVEVDVTVTAHGASRSCSTSFTPVKTG
jgi:hypothetical protein